MQIVYDFLNELIANNSKEWMDQNRHTYQQAKQVWLDKINDILKRLSVHDESLSSVNPKSTIMRINNNRRFHPDKPIYKHHFAFSPFPKEEASFYIHISPEGSFIAGGVYHPSTEALKKIREGIDYNGEELTGIVTRKSFADFYGGLAEDTEQLKTSPRDYSREHPHIELLRRRNFIAIRPVSAAEVTGSRFIDMVEKAYLELLPLNKYLKEAICFEP